MFKPTTLSPNSEGSKGQGGHVEEPSLFFFSWCLVVDGRLYKIGDRRLGHLFKSDLPILALALTAQQRGQCTVWREFTNNVAWFRLFSEAGNFDVRVRGDDWEKIEPYIRDGRWNLQVAPVEAVGWLHPDRELNVALLPQNDQVLYSRILGDLEREFPRDYPTSPL